jgi:hypothetical protein
VILTGAVGVSLTVAITAYAASRGRSPLLWGGASVLISAGSVLVSWVFVQVIGTTDLVFDQYGFAVAAMLLVLSGPVVAIVGNGALASRLVALPLLIMRNDSSWTMWKVGDRGEDGCECELRVGPDAIVGMRGTHKLFSIPRGRVSGAEVDGEALVLRSAGGPQFRLVLTDGDPDDRNARIGDILGVKRAIEHWLAAG